MKLRAILLRTTALLLFMAGAGFVAVKARGPRETPAAPAGRTGDAQQVEPVSNPAPQPVPQPNKLTFGSETVEARLAADATEARLDFSFENRTNRTLTVSRVEKNCDCVEMAISGGKLSYAPGERGVIRAKYTLGNMAGTVDKPFMLWMEGDSENAPSHSLVARLIIPELVKLSTKTVKWRIGREATPQKVEIGISGGQPIRLLPPACSSESIKAELKTIEDGRLYELWLTPTDTNNPGLTLVRIETDSAIPRWRVIQVFALVQQDLSNNP